MATNPHTTTQRPHIPHPLHFEPPTVLSATRPPAQPSLLFAENTIVPPSLENQPRHPILLRLMGQDQQTIPVNSALRTLLIMTYEQGGVHPRPTPGAAIQAARPVDLIPVLHIRRP